MFKYLADLITNNILRLEEGSKLSESLNFFIYDTIKILFLIIVVVFVISFIKTYFSERKIRTTLSKGKFGIANLVASMFGAVTPFCSCSSIPLFIGFLKAGIPTGVAFSFLITSPLVNEVVFVLMGGTFGWKIAIIYVVTGMLLGVVAGLILGKLKLDDQIIINNNNGKREEEYLPKTMKGKLEYSWKEGLKTFKKMFWYVVLGMVAGATIHGYVPADFFEKMLNGLGFFAVPIAVLIGVPIYAGCSTVVPIIYAVTLNGVPLGTALAFMMSVAGLSLPEALIIKRVLKMKLLLIFFGIVALGIIIIGYLFNFLMK
ncbi:MAG: permease [Patescibacteria group bacterium]|nr:permease [Patescibacteria group bacterium]